MRNGNINNSRLKLALATYVGELHRGNSVFGNGTELTPKIRNYERRSSFREG